MSEHLVYLGDGLYADFDGYQIELYSDNGIIKTNRVYLNPEVLASFQKWLANMATRQI